MATIVVADDDADVRGLLALAARVGGHRVIEVADGASAWEAVRGQSPQLLVTDVGMPGLTGLQLCRTVRSTPETADLPVILVTAGIPDGDTSEAGATALVVKPFRVRELALVINANLAMAPSAPSAPPAAVG